MTQKIAIITGASRGIGKIVSECLAKKNYFVILVARNKKMLEINCNHIVASGGKAVYYVVDVTKPDKIKACIEAVIKKYKRIDFLFNNAGIGRVGTTDITDQELVAVLDINLKGAIFFAKYAASQMKQQKSGYIINLSSLSGKVSSSTLGAYNASKFGLNGFSEALSKEMSASGVKVTTICPGMVATDMTADFNFKQEWMIQPSDIAITVDYLLSLSANALPMEVVIHCVPFVEKMSVAEAKIFGD